MNKRSLVFFDFFVEVVLRRYGVGVSILIIVFWIISVEEGNDILGVIVGLLSIVALILEEGNLEVSDDALFKIVGVRDVTKVSAVELHAVTKTVVATTNTIKNNDTRLFCFN